ncbi:succinate--CoA ligase subunit alpha [Trichloromonas sp.]|uniref:succinate--CoA ligase subunit alpha n=1 Tax=Trichloromonas sp. TaxID=3069249 RepID=UPI002A44575C|nr:succinate--CoA ligase subunit alpha [Trichloromonas sp.]
MSILINKDSRVVVQGITGNTGLFHTRQCREYGTKIVAGVTPGKGGIHVDGIPVFDSMDEALRITKANVSMIFVPPPGAADAILEAVEAGIELAVCITEGVPVRDMVLTKRIVEQSGTLLVGPNCPGLITPGECKVGIMPGYIHKPGKIGVVSRSGTLTYEAVKQISDVGLGQSTCIGIGGDPIIGMKFVDVIKMFNDDPETEAVFMIGEIGGGAEEEAAEWIRDHMTKPVAAFIAGVTAPPGKRMGHAGAIITGGKGKAEDKIRTLQECGVTVAVSPTRMGEAMLTALKG